MRDLFGFKLKEKAVVKDTLVCIKCNTTQPIDQFNAMNYASDKPSEIKRTCRT